MKANITFQKDIYSDDVHRITVYGDSKSDLLAVASRLSTYYVVSNLFISDDKKIEEKS